MEPHGPLQDGELKTVIVVEPLMFSVLTVVHMLYMAFSVFEIGAQGKHVVCVQNLIEQ